MRPKNYSNRQENRSNLDPSKITNTNNRGQRIKEVTNTILKNISNKKIIRNKNAESQLAPSEVYDESIINEVRKSISEKKNSSVKVQTFVDASLSSQKKIFYRLKEMETFLIKLSQ